MVGKFRGEGDGSEGVVDACGGIAVVVAVRVGDVRVVVGRSRGEQVACSVCRVARSTQRSIRCEGIGHGRHEKPWEATLAKNVEVHMPRQLVFQAVRVPRWAQCLVGVA